MSSDTEIALESTEAVENTGSMRRALPFSFAKRHGILIRDITSESAEAVCRPGIAPQSLADAADDVPF